MYVSGAGGGPHVTITHDGSDRTVQPPPRTGHQTWDPPWRQPCPRTSDMGPLLVTSGGHRWRPVQTGSFEYPLPPPVISGGGL